MGPPALVCYAVKLYHVKADARNAPCKKGLACEKDAPCRQGACLGLQLRHDGGGSVLFEDGLEFIDHLFALMITGNIAVGKHRLLNFNLMFKLGFKIRNLSFKCLHPLEFLLFIRGVITLVASDVTCIKLDHPVCNAVYEMSVMRNDKNSSAIRIKETLKPFDRLKIQVVRRLVKKDDIRMVNNEPCKTDTHLLTT